MLEKRLDRKVLYKGVFWDFVEDQIEIEDSDPPIRSIRQYLIHNGGVCIVPVLDDGRVIMVKQFRTPVGKVLYEFPAGKVDKGEEPFTTAKRELTEETGYTASEWTDMGETYPCPGYSSESLYFYIAKGLTDTGEQNLDYSEVVDPVIFTMEEALEKVRNGEIRDGKTINGLFFLVQS